jgi:hypothetical protein
LDVPDVGWQSDFGQPFQSNHGFAYWIYGVMSILAALFVWKFVPETKKRTLEQMEALWHVPVEKMSWPHFASRRRKRFVR